MKEITLPIDKLSFSSLSDLLNNPLMFKIKHILGVYDVPPSMSMMVGKAGHKALEYYYTNTELDKATRIAQAREEGLSYLAAQNDNYIKYGKTGSREKMLQMYNRAIDFYFSEEPEYHKVLMVEEKMESRIKTDDGQEMPLPITGIPDLVHERADGKVEIIDTKFTKSFTDYEKEDYSKILQAQFLGHLLEFAKGIKADRVLFREIKVTVNTDGSNQIRDYAIPLDHTPYRIIFYNLFKDAVKFLSQPEPVFLPNFSDMLNGEHTGLIYAQGLISSDMSDVEVMHKVRDVAFTTKQFIPSRLDKVENQSLLPEEKIKMRLAEFGIPVEPVEPVIGTSVIQYRFKVSAGIRMSTIKKHEADIALALGAKGSIQVLAPIPGTSFVGVEVEKEERAMVKLSGKDLTAGTLSIPVGLDINGNRVIAPLNEMPHLLIAGATGSGKSVLLNTIITALTKQLTPDEMGLLLIDPKRVELSGFAKKPHLIKPIIYELDEATKALRSVVDEMEARYKKLEKAGKRDISEFNATRKSSKTQLPYLVVVIDEYADLMLSAKMTRKAKKARRMAAIGVKYTPNLDDIDDDFTAEDLIVRLAQMARAVGIHLIIATQRPSVDVITGLIKANFPTRIALTTASAIDSKIIIGQAGAEKLNGKGDMLFSSPTSKGLIRLQGFYV